MKKILAIMAAVLLSCVGVSAQKAVISVQAPNVVAADEQFNVVFSVEGERAPADFSWDAGEDFQIVWGPQKGSSSSISIVNGKTTRSSQTSYTYILMPRKAGTFTLSRASATIKGEKVVSKEVTVQVVSAQGGASSSSQNRQSGGEDQVQAGTVSSDDLFMKLILDRSSVVVGEPIRATLKLYQRTDIAGFEGAKFPTFNGFWSQETAAPSNIEFQRENVNDRIYNSALIRSWVIIPQQAGDLTIEPAELVCLVNVRTSSGPRSIFDSFFESDYRTVRKRLTTEERKVHVSPLPGGAPASFGGGVGSFTMEAHVRGDSLKTHDAGSLIVTVRGRGNVSLLEAPKINFPPDFEVYDVKVTDSSDKSDGRTGGTRTFEYPFIPRSHGEFEIGPVEYSYFDSGSRKYVTLSSGPIQVRVSRGNEPSGGETLASQVISSVTRRDVKNLGSDIRFIATRTPAFSAGGSAFVLTPLFWVLLIMLLIAAAAVGAVVKIMEARRSDVALTRGRAATKMARGRLAQAKKFLDADLYTAFYEALHKALLGFVSDKLNMASAEMTKEHIASEIAARGIPEEMVSRLTGLLEECEFARYSPSAGHEAMDAHYRIALEIISFMDGNMKKKSSPGGAAVSVIALLLCCTLGLRAQAASDYPDSLWRAGVEAYSASDWREALSDWKGIESLGLESVELYYNIGNACFKTEDYAHAILYYERALRLDPSAADVQHNLAFARGFVQDRIEEVPEFFFKTWMRTLRDSMAGNVWCALFFVLLALGLAGMLVFILGHRRGVRKAGFFPGLVCLLLSFVCLGFSVSQRNAALRRDAAIVTRAVSAVKSTPGSGSSRDLFILHEGTKVKILDEVGEWRNIELADGRQGWMKAGDMEVI